MNRALKAFIKYFLIWAIPFFLIIASYFIYDPFFVLYHYDTYGSNYKKFYNRNNVSTSTFLNHNPKYHFKSFVFGSSRASAFTTPEWSKCINDPNPFHFDAFDDNIDGILSKLQFIKKQGNEIKNVLFVFDLDTFDNHHDVERSLPHLRDYRWSGQNYFSYQLEFFKSFFKKDYFVSYLDLKFFDTARSYMNDALLTKYFFTSPNNDFLFPEQEKEIKQDSVKFFSKPPFSTRTITHIENPSRIDTSYVRKLKEMKAILNADNAKYKVVISVRFDQMPFNRKDLQTLKNIFGAENVYDYSGFNEFSKSVGNFNDGSHYRALVGTKILQEIYQKK